MSIQSGDGVLEILDGTLKVSRLDIQDISGLDVAINTIARNMVLLRDDLTAAETPGGAVTSSTGVTRTQNTDITFTGGYVYWPIKVPNSWTMQFNVYDNLIFSFANTSTPSSAVASANHGGYKMVFDSANSWFSFYYQGSEIVATRTSYTTGQWLSVIVNYEYGGISVSIDGRQTMNYALTHGEDAYTGQYVGFASSATGKVRDIKLTNGDKWQYVPGSNAAAIAYMNGNVGIGSSSPQKTLDVGGDVKISGNLIVAGTTFTVDSQNLSIKDKIIELAGDNTDGDSNVGMIMTTGGTSNVAVGYRGQVGELMIGYTSNIASDTELTPKAGTNLPVKVYGDLEVTRALSGSTVSGDGYLLSNVTLSQVVDYGNTTSNTVQFNATDVALKTVGNVAIGTTTATIDLAIGDANTGLNQEGEDELAIYTAGSERVRVDSSGYVGISTSEPTANLHVVGSQYINNLPLGTGTSEYTHSAAPLTLTSASTTDTTPTSVLNLTRPADVEANVASRASLKLSRWSADTLTSSRSKLDISLASGIYTNEVTPLTLQANQKVGVMNTSPGHTLSVGTKLWVDETGSDVLTVSGNAYVSNKLTVEAFRISATTFDSLEAVTLAGNWTSSNIEISNTKTSTSQTTGALVVAGGVGIGKDLYATNVHASSYIGIGTVPPEASLHIGPKNSDHIYLASLDNNYGWKLDTYDQGAGDVPFRIIKRTGDVDSTVVTIKNQNGYVGIGTSPGAKLDIFSSSTDPGAVPTLHIGDGEVDYGDYGMLQLTRHPTSGGSKAHAAFIRNGNTVFGMGYHNNTNTFGFWSPFSTVINTPTMSFTTGGNVGIGTASPGQKLSIYTGSSTVSALSFDRYSTGNYRTDIYQNAYGPDFRVGYNTYTPESILYLKRLSDGSKEVEINGKVGIGTNSPGQVLHVHQNLPTTGHQICARIGGNTSTYSTLVFGSKENRPHIGGHRGDYAQWADLSLQNDVMVIQQSGNVGIGTTNPLARLTVGGSGLSSQTRISGDGYVGRYYNDGVAKGASIHFTNVAVLPSDSGFNLNNGGIELGWSIYRWGQIYSTSSTISTSDRTKKQDITDISSSERKVASKIIPLLKTFRMKDAVAKKGDEARIHTGVIAQDLIAAFESEGLDAHRYGLFCYDEKWTVDGEHELSEIVYEKDGKREYTNEDGEVVTYTKDDEGVDIVKYKIGTFADKDTPGAVLDSTIYSIRYEELLCFVVSVMVTNEELQAEKAKVATLETQLASVLTRLDALENP